MTIITLSGKRRVGKDTFADVLVSKYGFTKMAIADPLRNLCSRVFYIDPDMFLADDKKDERMQRIYVDFHDIDNIRKIVENEWGYEISEEARDMMEEFHGQGMDTPRDILRTVGMMLRDAVKPEIWIELALHKVKELGGKIVITDCRFENERDIFNKLGTLSVLIKRNDNGNSKEHEFDLGKDDEYDVIIKNDSTIHAYKSEIDMWYNTREPEFKHHKVWKYEVEVSNFPLVISKGKQ